MSKSKSHYEKMVEKFGSDEALQDAIKKEMKKYKLHYVAEYKEWFDGREFSREVNLKADNPEKAIKEAFQFFNKDGHPAILSSINIKLKGPSKPGRPKKSEE